MLIREHESEIGKDEEFDSRGRFVGSRRRGERVSRRSRGGDEAGQKMRWTSKLRNTPTRALREFDCQFDDEFEWGEKICRGMKYLIEIARAKKSSPVLSREKKRENKNKKSPIP